MPSFRLWGRATVARWADLDLRCAQAMHRVAANPHVVLALVVASRLGDGLLWYAVMALLPFVDGVHGMQTTLQMGAAALLNLGVYLVLKPRVGRPRPYQACDQIRACTPALDAYSFPSGHTMHAVAFAIVLGAHYPAAWLLAAPFALAVAASRVILGLHYPSDVAVGALLGTGAALLVLAGS